MSVGFLKTLLFFLYTIPLSIKFVDYVSIITLVINR